MNSSTGEVGDDRQHCCASGRIASDFSARCRPTCAGARIGSKRVPSSWMQPMRQREGVASSVRALQDSGCHRNTDGGGARLVEARESRAMGAVRRAPDRFAPPRDREHGSAKRRVLRALALGRLDHDRTVHDQRNKTGRVVAVVDQAASPRRAWLMPEGLSCLSDNTHSCITGCRSARARPAQPREQ